MLKKTWKLPKKYLKLDLMCGLTFLLFFLLIFKNQKSTYYENNQKRLINFRWQVFIGIDVNDYYPVLHIEQCYMDFLVIISINKHIANKSS